MKLMILILLAACGLLAQADNNTYTGAVTKAGTYNWAITSTDFTWSGGDASDEFYPTPKHGADVIMKVSESKTYIKLDTARPTDFTSMAWTIPSKGDVRLQSMNDSSPQTLTIGSGGISATSWGLAFGPLTLKLGASHTYKVTSATAFTMDGFVDWPVSLRSAEDVTWTVIGRNRIRFLVDSTTKYAGNSSQFLGKLVLSSGMYFQGLSQLVRLPKGGVTLTTETIDGIAPYTHLVWNFERSDGEAVLSMPFTFNLVNTLTDGTSGIGTFQPWIALASTDSSPDMRLRFTGEINGKIKDGCLLLGQSTGINSGLATRPAYAGLCRSDQQRISFENDNHDLVAYSGQPKILISTILGLGHDNALGMTNGVFGYQFHYGNQGGTQSRLMRAMIGLVATNGANVSGNMFLEANSTDANKSYGRMATVLLGSEGSGTSEFSGSISQLNTAQSDYRQQPELRFQGGEGGKAVFSGTIAVNCNKTVIGLGDVEIAGAENTFTSDPVGFRVRSGRLLISNPDAIKNSVASSSDLLLGDEVPTNVTVRAYFGGRWDLTDVGGTAPTLGDLNGKTGSDAVTNNVLTFTSAPQVDDVTLKVGDLVLVNSMGSIISGSDVWANGIWRVTSSLKWQRVEWLDDDFDVLAAHGTRVQVSEGTKFKGRTFYLANYEKQNYEQAKNGGATYGFHFGSKTYGSASVAKANDWLIFHDEPSFNPDVGFMLDGNFNYARDFTVVDNLSSGSSTVGSVSTGSSSFGGTITVKKDVLHLSAEMGGMVTFSNIVNVGTYTSVVKDGKGTVDISNAERLTLEGDSLTVNAGTLKATARFVGSKNLTIGCDDSSSGTLSVVGDINLEGREIRIVDNSTEEHGTSYTLVSATGTITGTPKLTGDGEGWTVVRRGNKIVVSFGNGAVLFWRRK